MTALFNDRELNGNTIAVWALVFIFPLLLGLRTFSTVELFNSLA